jgi:predicted nucleic acid-binding Zn ribbon protein
MVWHPLRTPRADSEPRPVAASLGRLASSLGTPQPDVLAAVFAGWEQVVGSSVAAHARPVTLRDGLLVVAVDQPAWATQINYLRADLLLRLSEAAGPGVVREVEVRVDNPGRSRRVR